MKRNPPPLLTLVLSGIVAAALAGCTKASPLKVIETHPVGGLTISLLSDSGELALGKNEFVIEFKSVATNQPVDVGQVVANSSMPMAGMAPMAAPIDLTAAGEAGRYRAKSDFSMSGTWRFSIQWDGPTGRGNTTFSQSVR